MPRQKGPVKSKLPARSHGLIDLHFHGAFGIDLMTAPFDRLDLLSGRLWENGVAGFCPTTLSAPPRELAEAVSRLGAWIRSESWKNGAIPLGIHLEGPFIAPSACGAHPPGSLRKADLGELDALWSASQKTLKILTVAPEQAPEAGLEKLVAWAKERKVVLSLGHSRATEEQARRAFDLGFSGVTHAWNALAFHHRSPGALGAALQRPGVHVELIVDQVHVAPTLVRWTLALHPKATCFISDCVSAAGTLDGTEHSFGSLRVRFADGASRLPDGSLAGGGLLLSDAYCRWLRSESVASGRPLTELLQKTLHHVTSSPLAAIGVSAKAFSNRRVVWRTEGGGLRVRPVRRG